jgi:hypothetical protein
MKAAEWLRVLVTLGVSAAEAVREARRKGDHRPAREVWRDVKTMRAAQRAYRERMEAFRRERERLGVEDDE